MKSRIFGKTILMALLFVNIASFQNCSKVTFSQDPDFNKPFSINPDGSINPPCVDVLERTTSNLKIIFMVDDSGSTNTTDPDKYYRAQTIQRFIDQYGTKPNLAFGFGNFSASGSIYDSVSRTFKTSTPVPFGTGSDLTKALSVYRTLSSDGTTNYRAAFDTVKNAILTDEAAHPGEFGYSVVFMSDGEPKDIDNPVEEGIKQIVGDLLQSVTNAGSGATVSSVYFGPSTETRAINNIKTVAEAGKGQFVDTSAQGGTDLTIANIITIPGYTCTQ